MFGRRKAQMEVLTSDIPLTTAKGMDIVTHSIISISPDKSQDFRLEAYLREKYNREQKPKEADAIASLSGGIFKKYYDICDDAKPRIIEEFITNLRENNPEYYLTLIRVEEKYKGCGVGSLMLEFSEHIFAKYLISQKKEKGIIRGMLVPFDRTKKEETRNFYIKHGFGTYKYKGLDGNPAELIYKSLVAEEVMDRPSREFFERTI